MPTEKEEKDTNKPKTITSCARHCTQYHTYTHTHTCTHTRAQHAHTHIYIGKHANTKHAHSRRVNRPPHMKQSGGHHLRVCVPEHIFGDNRHLFLPFRVAENTLSCAQSGTPQARTRAHTHRERERHTQATPNMSEPLTTVQQYQCSSNVL